MDVLQTRKVLSNVNQVFKQNYNRVTFEISPIAGLATDLTKSYISFRMYLAFQSNGVQLTVDDYKSLLDNNLMVEFGQNGFSYPAASLIQVARLYARDDAGSPLEEILYQNVWATTMHQLKQDFETLGAESLSSGTAVSFNSNGSLASQITALMLSTTAADGSVQLPVEIHIPLSDIFGICKNTHMDLSLTGGLIIQFELEPIKHLFQTRAIGTPVPMPVLMDASGVGFPAQPEVSPWTFLPDGQGNTLMPSYKFATQHYDASGNAFVQPPNGYHYSGITYAFFDPTNPVTASTQTITLAGLWDAQQMTDAKFVAGNAIKLNFRYADPLDKFRPKMIEMMDYITGVTPSATVNESIITLAQVYKAPAGVSVLEATQVTFHSFDVYESTQVAGLSALQAVPLSLVNGTGDHFTSAADFFQHNTVTVAESVFQSLCDAGVIVNDSNGSWTGGESFRLVAQPFDETTGFAVPWTDAFVYPDSTTQRQIWTAQAKPLAIQGTDCQILSVGGIDASGNRAILFKDFGFANDNSLQNGVVLKTSLGYEPTLVAQGAPVTGGNANIQLAIFLMRSRTKPLTGSLTAADYTYQIDKAEIVLVEMTLDPSIPQTMVYETLRVEVATIETDTLDIYNRQFTVNEPSCFNAWLLTPQYTASSRKKWSAISDASGNSFYSYHPECLVSYARNVSQYKWSYNNIQNTNRYVEVQTNASKYPSSLHLEKLMDCYSNTTEKMKNFSGILTVPRTANDPVVCFPLRIYEAMDTGSTYLREGGFTLQIELLGDSTHDQNIVSGAIFLYKQILKTIR